MVVAVQRGRMKRCSMVEQAPFEWTAASGGPMLEHMHPQRDCSLWMSHDRAGTPPKEDASVEQSQRSTGKEQEGRSSREETTTT